MYSKRIGSFHYLEKKLLSVPNRCVLVHQTVAPLSREILSVLQGNSLFTVIFRESAKYIELLLYSEKSVEV